MPPKPDLVFADEHVVSESITSLHDIAKSEVKTSEIKLKNISAPIIEDWISDSHDENEIETKSKQIKPIFAKVKFVKPTEHVKSPRKSVKKEKNNRPTRNVIDHISKDSGSYMLKRFNYVDLQDRLKSAYTYYYQMKVNAATHKLTTDGDGYRCWVKTVNEDVHIRALVDGKKIIITEASIRRDLRLDDAEGTTCLPNAAIFEELARMGDMSCHKGIFVNPSLTKNVFANMKRVGTRFSGRTQKSRRKQRKETKVPHTKPQTKEHIPTPSHDPLLSGEDGMQLSELMKICTKLSDMVLSLEQIKTNQAAEIEKLKKRVKKLKGKKKKRTHGLKWLYKVGLTARVESSEEEKGLGDQEDASKHERIAEIYAHKDLSLINETAQDQRRINDEDLFRVNDLDGDDVIVDVTAGENVEHDAIVAEKETLIEIKAAKPKTRGVIVQEPSEFKITSSSQPSQLPHDKDKGKGIMVEPEKPLKKKDQIAFDKEVTKKLDAQMKAKMEEEERITREKDEVNRVVIEEWDDVQATNDADMQLAEQLQAQEREQLSIEERSKLLAKLIESRRKYLLLRELKRSETSHP
nr:hypothetical protein [Tanacetum cinerariifolium]